MSDSVTKSEVIDILKDIEEDVDYDNCTALWDERHLDSFDVLQIVSAFDDEFDIKIPAKEIVPEEEIYLRVNKNNPASLCVQLHNGGYIEGEDEDKYYVRIRKDGIAEEGML